MRYQTTYQCELGPILLECDGEALLGLWLDLYFAGKNPEMEIKLRPEGTEFQKRVWKELLKIPYGETTTYGAIANALQIRSG